MWLVSEGVVSTGMQGPAVTSNAIIWLDDASVLHSVSVPNSHGTEETVKEEIAAMKALTGDRRRPLMVDARSVVSMERAARVGTVRSGFELASAAAMLVGPPISMVIMSFVLSLNESSVPLRLFTHHAPALEWLHGFLDHPDSPVGLLTPVR